MVVQGHEFFIYAVMTVPLVAALYFTTVPPPEPVHRG